MVQHTEVIKTDIVLSKYSLRWLLILQLIFLLKRKAIFEIQILGGEGMSFKSLEVGVNEKTVLMHSVRLE